MKNLSIILIGALMALVACTKSKEVHPEIGDGNDEIVTVGMKDVHVKYLRTDHEDLQKVVFHYSLSETQQFAVAEMTKRETFFELTLNDLYSDTLYYYYYELFPISGNAYHSERKTFYTQAVDTPEPPEPPTPSTEAPEGAINGLFTINENGDQVYFSQGNLQYQATTNTWRFAEHQWDYVGSEVVWEGNPGGTVIGNSNHLISELYDGWIDLFGWGTSGYNHGAVCYQPWSTSNNSHDYYAYGQSYYNLYDQTGQADWGYNAISNGGNLSHQWRTLTIDEWEYMLFIRSPLSGVRFAKAIVNGVNGVVLLPDNWSTAIHVLNDVNVREAQFIANEITIDEWNIMESHGAVFLSAAGWRWTPDKISNIGVEGCYKSSSRDLDNDSGALGVCFDNSNFSRFNAFSRERGQSVRLVCVPQ